MILMLSHAPRERVSWNNRTNFVSCNVATSRSTWACELKLLDLMRYRHLWKSRSTWACELKFGIYISLSKNSSHAPRERVSWNLRYALTIWTNWVTLHVSVWVEIQRFVDMGKRSYVTLHVSVWVEISQWEEIYLQIGVTLHVSVWVEMYVHFYVCVKW